MPVCWRVWVETSQWSRVRFLSPSVTFSQGLCVTMYNVFPDDWAKRFHSLLRSILMHTGQHFIRTPTPPLLILRLLNKMQERQQTAVQRQLTLTGHPQQNTHTLIITCSNSKTRSLFSVAWNAWSAKPPEKTSRKLWPTQLHHTRSQQRKAWISCKVPPKAEN